VAFASTAALRRELADTVPERPFGIEFWDGTSVPSTSGNGPTFRLNSPAAIGHVLRAPGQLGLGRAYVTGAIEVNDLDAALALLDTWQPPKPERRRSARLAAAALRAHGVARLPAPPRSELRLRGERHTLARDRRAVRHHYDVGNDFFALFLDSSMTYSCAIFSRGARTLEEAQETKLELVCKKLGLEPGQRVLDVGCGWGSFPIHAAKHHGVEVVGITLSEPQAELARRRAADAGVGERVDIRVMDYRQLSEERFDAIASIGMVEHVGNSQIDLYTRCLAALLRPGGRLLNHGIARLRHGDPEADKFSNRFVFPDAAPLHLGRVQLALEQAGFITDHVEGFADDYAETLMHWRNRLDDRITDAVRLGGAERARIWRLYLRAARAGFRSGFLSVYQVRCHRA
jgi:cyclopropane-fatty-acyl-phospholipid synthase